MALRRLTATTLIAGLVSAVSASELPDLGCLKLVRSARAAEMSGDCERGLELLQQAVREFPIEIVPLSELLATQSRCGVEDRNEELRELLRRRLASPEASLPASVALFMATDRRASDSDREALLRAVESRFTAASGTAEAAGYLEAAVQIEIDLGRREAARRHLDQLMKIDSSEHFLWRAFDLDVQLERWEQAVALVRTRISDGSSPAWVEEMYLRSLVGLGPSAELDEVLGDIMGSHRPGVEIPREVYSLLSEVAWQFYDQEFDTRSEEIFRYLAERTEKEAPNKILFHLFGDREAGQEIALTDALTEEGARDPDVLYEKGTSLLASGEAASAIDLLAEAAEALPSFEPAWYNYGLAAMHLKRWAEAERAFRKVSELNPDRDEALLNRGLAHYHLGQCSESVALLERFLVRAPDRYQPVYYQAICLEALGESVRAARVMESYRRRKP